MDAMLTLPVELDWSAAESVSLLGLNAIDIHWQCVRRDAGWTLIDAAKLPEQTRLDGETYIMQ